MPVLDNAVVGVGPLMGSVHVANGCRRQLTVANGHVPCVHLNAQGGEVLCRQCELKFGQTRKDHAVRQRVTTNLKPTIHLA